MRSFIGLITGFALLLAAGCGSASLTRGRATGLIEQEKEPVMLTLSKDECEKGAQAGYWKWVYEEGALGNPTFDYHTFQLTDLGMKVFEGDGKPQRGVRPGYVNVKIRQPIARKVLEVTGITGDERTKVVDVTWCWDLGTLPSDLRGILKNPSKSWGIQFQLYDDGWRIAGRRR